MSHAPLWEGGAAPRDAAFYNEAYLPSASICRRTRSAITWRRAAVAAGSLAVALWLIILSAKVTSLSNTVQAHWASVQDFITTSPLTSASCAAFGASTVSTSPAGTPLSLAPDGSGAVRPGIGTSLYIGGAAQLRFSDDATIASHMRITALSGSSVLLTMRNGSATYAQVVSTSATWLDGVSLPVLGAAPPAATRQLPFTPLEVVALASPAAATAGSTIVFVGSGELQVAYPFGEGIILGQRATFTNALLASVHVAPLSSNCFALTYYAPVAGAADLALMAQVGCVSALGNVTLGAAVPVAPNHETHATVAVGPNAFVVLFPMDNATAAVTDDDEAPGFALGALLLTLPIDSTAPLTLCDAVSCGVTVATAQPWTLPTVRVHYFMEAVCTGVNTVLSSTAPRAAAAMLRAPAVGAAPTVIQRALVTSAVVDRVVDDAIRLLSMEVLCAWDGHTSACSSAALLWADTFTATPGGGGSGYHVASLAVLDASQSGMAHVSLTYVSTAANWAVQNTIVSQRMLDGALTHGTYPSMLTQPLPLQFDVAVARTGVRGVPPAVASLPYSTATVWMDSVVVGSGQLLVATLVQTSGGFGVSNAGNLSLVEHTRAAVGVAAAPLQCIGSGVDIPSQPTLAVKVGGVMDVSAAAISTLEAGRPVVGTTRGGLLTAPATTSAAIPICVPWQPAWAPLASTVCLVDAASAAVGTALSSSTVVLNGLSPLLMT